MRACVGLITGSRSTLKKKQFEISTNDRVSVFIELADAYRQLGQQVRSLSPRQLFYNHNTGQRALPSTLSEQPKHFVGAKFHCPHAIADGN